MKEKTKEQVREELVLDQLPDEEFMQLLAEVGDAPIVTGPQITGAAAEYTPERIANELTDVLVTTTVGGLLAQARAEAGLSLRDVGAAAGVSHGRIQQVEGSDNLEVATLVRVADALGYAVQITLVPERHDRRPLRADLSRLDL